MKKILFALMLLCTTAAHAADGPYLFDLLKQPAYKSAWKAMLKGEKTDGWIGNGNKIPEGPSSPSKTVQVNGQDYLLANTCKQHDCGNNYLYILFAPEGKQAWGMLHGKTPRWYGKPDETIKNTMLSKTVKK